MAGVIFDPITTVVIYSIAVLVAFTVAAGVAEWLDSRAEKREALSPDKERLS